MVSKRRKAVSRSLDGFVELAVRQLQFRFHQTVTIATPVLSGFARAGWTLSVGSPEPGPSTSVASRTRGLTAAQRIRLGRVQANALAKKNIQVRNALARGYKLKQGPVFIVNAVRYVTFLNDGSSAQAPAMFVERSLATAVKATVKALQRVGKK